MTRPIQVEIDVKSAAAIGAFAGIAQSAASAGIALVQAGIQAGIDAIGNSIDLASDKAEAASKAQVLFGDSFDRVRAASESAATSVGLSSGAYLAAAGNVGNLITNLGFTGDAAAKMSTDIVQLSADLGSFNNLPTDQAVQAIGAAFRGETEPIRAFGVMLDEATIKAKAVELGLYSGVGAIDKNAKATATYQLILEQTTNAQGDFARTSDGLANSQRINAAKLEDAWTRVGEKLAPIAQTILPILADGIIALVDGIGQLIGDIQTWIGHNQELIDNLVNIGRLVWDVIVKSLQAFVDIVGELGYRIGGLIGAFIDLAGAIVDAGAAIVKVMQGDFAGAAADGERLISRLQGFQENVQRAMGDTSRRLADEVAIYTERTAQDARDALDAQPEVFQMVGTKSGEAYGDGLTGAVEDAKDDAADIAAETPGEMAQRLRASRSGWKDALSQLGDDLKNAMSAAQETAELQAALTGKRLARGLESTDPIVRAQAEETKALIEARLAELGDIGQRAGAAVGTGLSVALHAAYDKVGNATNGLARIIDRKLTLNSPAKEGPWSERGGPIEWMRRNGERMADALDMGLNRTLIRPPQLSLALAAPGGPGGPGRQLAPVTVNIYAGVGDPVEIGRQVSEALRAYNRASGTE